MIDKHTPMENILAFLGTDRKYVVLRQRDDLLLLGSLVKQLSSGDIKVVLLTVQGAAIDDATSKDVQLPEIGGVVKEVQFQQINDRVSPGLVPKLVNETAIPLQNTEHLKQTVTQLCHGDRQSRPHYVSYASDNLLIMIVNKQRTGQSFMLQSSGLSNRGTLHECINEWRTRIVNKN